MTKHRKQSQKSLKNKKLLLIITGSIAAYKAGDLVSDLRQTGAKVTCVLTDCAKQFVTPLTLRALSGQKVYHDFFSQDSPYDVLHTSLAEEADLVIVCPASANFIARLAAGFANDLASCCVLASSKPVLIVPAMNDHMYRHPLTQKNIKVLRHEAGYHFLDPIVGHLVCGKEAVGHVAENTSIIQTIQGMI